jgi:hypothetical protein
MKRSLLATKLHNVTPEQALYSIQHLPTQDTSVRNTGTRSCWNQNFDFRYLYTCRYTRCKQSMGEF